MWTGKLMCMLFLPNRVLIGQKTFQSNSRVSSRSQSFLFQIWPPVIFVVFFSLFTPSQNQELKGKGLSMEKGNNGDGRCISRPIGWTRDATPEAPLVVCVVVSSSRADVKVKREHTGMESTALSWIAHICLIRMILPLFCFIFISVLTLPSLTSIFSLHPSKPALCSTPVS